jgi:hypothetical protein
MRPLELALHVLLVAACIDSLATDGLASIISSSVLTGAALLSIALQRWLEGHRWQLTLAYAATGCQLVILAMVVLQATLANPTAAPAAIKYTAAAILFLCLLISSLLCFLFPMFKFPQPTGPYQVACHDFELVDPDRPSWTEPWEFDSSEPRHMYARIWYPTSLTQPEATAAADQKERHSSLEVPTDASDAKPAGGSDPSSQPTPPPPSPAAAAAAAAKASKAGIIKRAVYYAHVHLRGPAYARDFKMPPYLLTHLQHLRSNAWVPASSASSTSTCLSNTVTHATASGACPDAPPLPVDPIQQRYPVIIFSHGFTGECQQQRHCQHSHTHSQPKASRLSRCHMCVVLHCSAQLT